MKISQDAGSIPATSTYIMRKHKVIYTINGKRCSSTVAHASTPQEASKMIELEARWKDLSAEVEILSAERIPINWSKFPESPPRNTLKKNYLFNYLERDH